MVKAEAGLSAGSENLRVMRYCCSEIWCRGQMRELKFLCDNISWESEMTENEWRR